MGSPRNGAQGAFSLELPVGLSAVEDCRIALLAYLRPFDIDQQALNRLEVVLEELLSNVARHSDGVDLLTIEADFADGAIWLAIEDNGAAFNPLDAPDPPPFTTLEEAKIGGQGVPLIRRLSNDATYERVGKNNRLTASIAVS
jgi:serine/threonine-protein kinase RsbW